MVCRRFSFLLLLLLAGCAEPAADPGYTVVTHPDGKIYVGDWVSFEVFAPAREPEGQTVEISFEGGSLGTSDFSPFGIGARDQATFWWVWETTGLIPGVYTLTFTLGSGDTWVEEVRLYPAARVPAPEPQAAWVSTTSVCCEIHYISGTDAARDITILSEIADQRSSAVASQLGVILQERIPLIFMPRVIGHGGFAWDGVYVSYLDENYVGNEMEMVLHHEFVHYYDDWIGGAYMPSILQEGYAVYLSGGHFKPEALAPRAAALLALDWYIPLADLANDFYNQQHDIGYLEAAAFVGYLHEIRGPGTFMEFYRTIPYLENASEAEILDAALVAAYGSSLDEMETDFRQYLAAQVVTEQVRLDLELTVAYFDAVRHYQSLFDPSAYFLTAWLPNGQEMRSRGIVADFTRRPAAWQNLLLERLLIMDHARLFAAEYDPAARTLGWTNWILEFLEP